MALNYEQSAALMNDFEFRGKVQVAALKFADSIMIEASNVPAHNTRFRWATATFQAPGQAAQTLHPPVVMDAGIQAAGVDAEGKSLATDPQVQGAVEAVVGKML